jgi:enoyl-CoA hydratase/carnithine racemase
MSGKPAELSVLSERRGSVLIVTLNRPDRLNAWTDELEHRYFDLLEEAAVDREVRAVVLTGAGRGFCAGADIGEIDARLGEEGPVAAAVRTRPHTYPLHFPKPLIAAINGAAAGLGLIAALCCDIRFCVPEAKLATAFARRGLIAEYGSSWLLSRIVGAGRARDLLLSGRVVRGEEAHRIGLVDVLVPPDRLLTEALAYADELAGLSSPAAMAAIKGQLLRDLDRPLDEALADAEALLAVSLGWPDLREGVASYLERRPPSFPPLSTEEGKRWISS